MSQHPPRPQQPEGGDADAVPHGAVAQHGLELGDGEGAGADGVLGLRALFSTEHYDILFEKARDRILELEEEINVRVDVTDAVPGADDRVMTIRLAAGMYGDASSVRSGIAH